MKSSGFFIFKEYYEERLISSKVTDMQRNKTYHLVFPSKDKDTYESAFEAFCYNLLYLESYNDKALSYEELDAMNSINNLNIEMAVNIRRLRVEKTKTIISNIIKLLPSGLHSGNIPLFCVLLHYISREPLFIRSLNLVDENTAQHMNKTVKYLKPNDSNSKYIGLIGDVLEQIYRCVHGKSSCVVGFIGNTLSFLPEAHLSTLVQKSVEHSPNSMSLYVKSHDFELESVLIETLKASEYSLLDKMLRHLLSWCSFEQYISLLCVLLDDAASKPDIFEKLVDSCIQKCTQYLTKLAKTSDLKGFLRNCQLILPLPVVCSGLYQTIEKNILDFLGNEGKLITLDSKTEFLHMILERKFFDTIEGKEDLLKLLVSCKRALLRSCVINLLQDESFQDLPDDCASKVIVQYMQNSLQFNRKKFTLIETVKKAYEDLHSLLQLPVVRGRESIGVQIDQIVLKSVEQNNIKDLLKVVDEIEKTEHLHKFFQGHIRTILHDKHSQKLPSTVIREICGREHLRVNTR